VRPSGLEIADRAPPGVQLISGPGRSHYERGNLMFRCTEPAGDVLVKVYRRRKSRWSDFWGNVSERWFERKRGVSAARRRETEKSGLLAWSAAGFDVPRLLERERPPWLGDHPFLALEFVAGPTLHQALEDPAHPLALRQQLVARLARDYSRRHRCALERGETLLIHEHAMARHVLVSGDRLVTFDFEHAYRPGYPLAVAIAFELASTVRSLERLGPHHVDAFVEGYEEPAILEQSCRLFRSSSLRWRLYRRYEAHQRKAMSKTAAMERLAVRLNV
jgi:hypothetical protein